MIEANRNDICRAKDDMAGTNVVAEWIEYGGPKSAACIAEGLI
jgi:hypothetical protein